MAELTAALRDELLADLVLQGYHELHALLQALPVNNTCPEQFGHLLESLACDSPICALIVFFNTNSLSNGYTGWICSAIICSWCVVGCLWIGQMRPEQLLTSLLLTTIVFRPDFVNTMYLQRVV